MLLGNVEGVVEIVDGVVLAQLVVVDELGPVAVYEGAEGEAVLEAHVKVLHVHVLVRLRLALAPEQQALLGRHLLDADVLDGEAQDDRPDHAERHLQIAVDNLLGADADQLDALALYEAERLVHVGYLVKAHLAAVGLGQLLARDDLEQQHELEAVAEVLVDLLDLGAGLAQVRVAPGGERLALLLLPQRVEQALALPLLLLLHVVLGVRVRDVARVVRVQAQAAGASAHHARLALLHVG